MRSFFSDATVLVTCSSPFKGIVGSKFVGMRDYNCGRYVLLSVLFISINDEE